MKLRGSGEVKNAVNVLYIYHLAFYLVPVFKSTLCHLLVFTQDKKMGQGGPKMRCIINDEISYECHVYEINFYYLTKKMSSTKQHSHYYPLDNISDPFNTIHQSLMVKNILWT